MATIKIRWTIEGTGCSFQQCGLTKGHVLIIESDELPTDPISRAKWIDDAVQDEFDRSVYPVWDERH
jgi:hypothetical protein